MSVPVFDTKFVGAIVQEIMQFLMILNKLTLVMRYNIQNNEIA